MKLTTDQLRTLVREELAHPRSGLGTNIADVEFPIVVGYDGKSEIAYDQDGLDDILDDITQDGTAYSLDSLEDMEPRDVPVGAAIEQFGESMKITKRQLRRIIREVVDTRLPPMTPEYVRSSLMAKQVFGPNRGRTRMDLTLDALTNNSMTRAANHVMDALMIDDPPDGSEKELEDLLAGALSADDVVRVAADWGTKYFRN
jgi:hypothetical protein